MERLISLGIGYVLGMIQTAFIYGKMNGIDIREHGSGNAGTTNTLRVLGKKAGLIVFIFDVLKSILAIVVVRIIYSDSHQDMMPLLSLYAGTGAILGHNFPFYLKFRGGKGIAATAGIILAFDWRFTIVGVIVFFSIFFITHYVSLGSLLVYVAFMTELIIFGKFNLFHMEQPLIYELCAVGAFLSIMAFVKHRANIVRLVHGEERKTYLTKKSEEIIK